MTDDIINKEQYTRGIQDTLALLEKAATYDVAIDMILDMCKNEPEKGRLVLKTLIVHGATHIGESFAKSAQAMRASFTKDKEDADGSDTST